MKTYHNTIGHTPTKYEDEQKPFVNLKDYREVLHGFNASGKIQTAIHAELRKRIDNLLELRDEREDVIQSQHKQLLGYTTVLASLVKHSSLKALKACIEECSKDLFTQSEDGDNALQLVEEEFHGR